MSTDAEAPKTIKVKSPAMAKNDEQAAENRRFFEERRILAINIMSAPGSGKTTLLEAMARQLGRDMVVIEGDVQTRRDAERVERAGCRAYQIETRGACHLDAQAVAHAMDELDLRLEPCKILIVENIGNLICPSSYDLGEHARVGLLSVTEGDDKVLKYPALFSRIHMLVLNKIDLLPYVAFDVNRAVEECRSLNQHVSVFQTSATTGQGIDAFCQRLLAQREEMATS